jgi:ubiquinol-cytochrome c reductase cytochrome c subunit
MSSVRKYAVWLTSLVVVCGTVSAQAPDDGEALFVANGCYQCHGYQGQGGAAPRIAPTVYPYEAFDRLVRRPANEMPAYAREALRDEALRAIYRYVRAQAEPPPVADIALLR